MPRGPAAGAVAAIEQLIDRIDTPLDAAQRGVEQRREAVGEVRGHGVHAEHARQIATQRDAREFDDDARETRRRFAVAREDELEPQIPTGRAHHEAVGDALVMLRMEIGRHSTPAPADRQAPSSFSATSDVVVWTSMRVLAGRWPVSHDAMPDAAPPTGIERLRQVAPAFRDQWQRGGVLLGDGQTLKIEHRRLAGGAKQMQSPGVVAAIPDCAESVCVIERRYR